MPSSPGTPATLSRVAVLDDYQGIALDMAPWRRLPAGIAVEAFRDTLADPDALVARLVPFEAIVLMRERTPFPRALIERLPRLKLLVTTGARNNAVDAAACAERGIVFCGTPAFGDATAQLAWGLILALLRDLPGQQQALREGRWQTGLGRDLGALTLGIIGLGKLGGRMAKVAAAFGMRVVAWSENLTDERAAAHGAVRVSKEELLREADVVTLHLVLSERSRGTLGSAELALMKRSAFLVNTSRAGLVDQDALVAALTEGRIAGAGLDVFDREPLPAGHPLLTAPNTILTPHLGYVTQENYRAYYAGALEAIEAFLTGVPIRTIAA